MTLAMQIRALRDQTERCMDHAAEQHAQAIADGRPDVAESWAPLMEQYWLIIRHLTAALALAERV